MALVIIACVTIPIIYLITFIWKLLCQVVPFLKWVGITVIVIGCPVFSYFVMKYGSPCEPGFETVFGYVFVSVVYIVVCVVLWLLTSPLHMIFGMFNTAKEKPKFDEPEKT